MATETQAVSTGKSAIFWLFYWMVKAFATAALWSACVAIGFVGMMVVIGPLVGFALGMWGTVLIWWSNDYKTPAGANPEEQGLAYWVTCWMAKTIATLSLLIGCFFLGLWGLIFLAGPLIGIAVGFLGTIVIWAPSVFEGYKNIEKNTG